MASKLGLVLSAACPTRGQEGPAGLLGVALPCCPRRACPSAGHLVLRLRRSGRLCTEPHERPLISSSEICFPAPAPSAAPGLPPGAAPTASASAVFPGGYLLSPSFQNVPPYLLGHRQKVRSHRRGRTPCPCLLCVGAAVPLGLTDTWAQMSASPGRMFGLSSPGSSHPQPLGAPQCRGDGSRGHPSVLWVPSLRHDCLLLLPSEQKLST